MKKVILFSAIIITLGIIAFIGYKYSMKLINEKTGITEDVYINIPKGCSLNSSIEILNNGGLLKPEWFFKNVAKVYAKTSERVVYAGYYRFTPSNTNLEVLKAIFSGKQLHTIRVTFPEGILLQDFASIAAKELGSDSARFMEIVNSPSFLEQNNIPSRTAEGYLMPDTYEFYRNPKEGDVINKLIAQQNKIWNEKFASMAKDRDMTRHEVLTLASIIEAETPVPDERPKVSGVYHNRLKIGLLLQADPTVQYANGNKKRLLYRDLKVNSPYNTYKFPGLPPGPINAPNASSIEAAIAYEEHDYLFFCAIGDGSGRHNFAKNSAQHSRFVAQYRRNRNR